MRPGLLRIRIGAPRRQVSRNIARHVGIGIGYGRHGRILGYAAAIVRAVSETQRGFEVRAIASGRRVRHHGAAGEICLGSAISVDRCTAGIKSQ